MTSEGYILPSSVSAFALSVISYMIFFLGRREFFYAVSDIIRPILSICRPFLSNLYLRYRILGLDITLFLIRDETKVQRSLRVCFTCGTVEE